MPSAVELNVEYVESTLEGAAMCVVRCLAGVAEPGLRLTVKTDSSVDLQLDWIKRYERLVDILDPPHNAKIQVSGRGSETLGKGAKLVSQERV
jgi:hypothetical protein